MSGMRQSWTLWTSGDHQQSVMDTLPQHEPSKSKDQGLYLMRKILLSFLERTKQLQKGVRYVKVYQDIK